MKPCFVPGKGMRLVDAAPLAAYLSQQLSACKEKLQDYAHPFSPKKFTRPQLKVLVDLREHSLLMNSLAQRSVFGTTQEQTELLLHSLRSIAPDFGRISFRQLVNLLKCNPELVRVLERRRSPTYSTLAHAARRLEEKH
jgi:hypothetical protein